jgi:hypothetical protein
VHKGCVQRVYTKSLQAPLEFSNPITGADSVPNGRAMFTPKKGDFVLFPSYLPHTVPMRHASSTERPRISIAFNIWFEGKALDRCCSARTLNRVWTTFSTHPQWLGVCPLEIVNTNSIEETSAKC